ncbi:protocadherin Fat 3-like [Uranotaenia lowii]|uniref:protocadherin Fat 3-like n=1 Tax=Uranotaenia lowii TaxID=190385 RepID=UPI00247912B0|nr:protocadherin Fat 3-like [Uranotaenia lowii]
MIPDNRLKRTRLRLSRGLLLLVMSLLIEEIYGQACYSETFNFESSPHVNPEISALDVEKAIATHQVENVRSVTVSALGNFKLFLTATIIDQSQLVISTTAAFENYLQTETSDTLYCVLDFTCTTGTKSIRFQARLKSENIHAPEFRLAEYTIKLPLPLPKDFIVTQYIEGGSIIARDADISGNVISFSLDGNDYFSVASVSSGTKEYEAVLKTTRTILSFENEVTLRLTGTDSFDPPKSGSTVVKISGDPIIQYVEPPKFQQSLHMASFKRSEPFRPIEASLEPNTFDSTVTFVLSGDDEGWFTITKDDDRGGVSVALKSAPELPAEQSFFGVVVTATRQEAVLPGRTAVVVELETEVQIHARFVEDVYSGSLDVDKKIVLDKDIELVHESVGEEYTIDLSGDDAQYFSVEKDGYGVKLQVSALLTDEVLRERVVFHFTIIANKEGNSGMTFVVLEVKQIGGPKFSELYYEGVISEDLTTNIPQVVIEEESYRAGLKFSYSGDQIDYFDFEENGNTISITSKPSLFDNLDGLAFILIRIGGSLDEKIVSESLVILKVIRIDIITPQFNEPFLQGQITKKTMELTELKITLSSDTYSQETSLVLKDSSNLFELVESTIPNERLLKLKTGTTELPENHYSLFVEATNQKSITTYCFILIDVLEDPVIVPKFERLVYEGLIDDQNRLEDLKLKLTSDTYDDQIDYDLLNDDYELFKVEKLTDTKEILISLKAPLSPEEISNRNRLRFDVQARSPQGALTMVPVIIQIQTAIAKLPKFEQPLYKTVIGTNLQLIPFTDPIQLTEETRAQDLSVRILLSNSDLFEAEIDSESTVVSIRLKQDLTLEDTAGVSWFEFVLEVSNEGVGSGYATILVDIERIPVPEFTASIYEGTIKEGSNEFVFPEAIALREGTKSTGIVVDVDGDDSSLVVVKLNEDFSVTVTLDESVTVQDLKNRNQLSFVIEAQNQAKGIGFASIVSKIIRPVAVAFTKPSFSGVLKEGSSTVDFSGDAIEFVDGSVSETTTLTLLGDDSSFLDVLLIDGVIEVSLKVPWNNIRNRPFLNIMLQGTNPDTETASASLLVNVVNNPVVTPVFTKTFYRGFLPKGLHEVNFAAAEIITIQEDTITTSFNYRVVENDHDMFLVTKDGNQFHVTLKSDQNVENRDILSFQIEAYNLYGATDSATVIVNIQMDEIIVPQFQQTIYKGSIEEQSSTLESPEITFKPDTFTANTEVVTVDGDSAWFTALYESSKVTVTLNQEQPINWDELSDRHNLNFLLQATNPGSQPSNTFITLDIIRTKPTIPKFKSPAFIGYLEQGDRQVKFNPNEHIELESDTVLPGSGLELLNDDSDLFYGAINDNRLTVALKESVTEDDLNDKRNLRFSVVVTNQPSGSSGSAVVIVELRFGETSTMRRPSFEKAVYSGSFDDDYTLTLGEEVMLSQDDSYSEDITVRILDSNSNLFSLNRNGRKVELLLARDVTAEDFRDLEYVFVAIEATIPDEGSGTCFMVIMLPDEKDGTCTERPPIFDCTECFDCSTGLPLDDVPVFSYGNYRFAIKTETLGMVGLVRALAKDPSAVIEHRALIDHDYLKERVSFTKEGILRVDQQLASDHYSFLVEAINVDSKKLATVSVTLDVTQDRECPANPDDPKVVSVEKALVVLSLQEESPHPNVYPTQLGQCEYEMIDERPNGESMYFSVDSETHWLTAKAFDRENAELFQGMTIPQFQLRLQLVCPNEEPQPEPESRLFKRSLIETEDINYARDVTVINVIVEDVNDNDPYFVNPSGNVNIGYPTASIAANLLLPELITVQAEDIDEGLNSKIRYSVKSNEHFAVEPNSGRVFPLKDALKSTDTIDLKVLATDRDGADDGRSTELILKVHRLEADNLVMLKIEGVDMASTVIDSINSNSENITLQILTSARIPANSEGRLASKQSTSSDVVHQMIIYGFNNRNELQNSEQIRSIIDPSQLIVTVVVESYQSTVGNADCSQTGLIVATSVLAVLFALSAGIAVFLYLRYVRPLRNASADRSDTVQLENDFEISPPPSPPTLGTKRVEEESSPVKNERKISLMIEGITDQESEDTYQVPTMDRLARSLDDRLERVDEYGTISSRDVLSLDNDGSYISEPKSVTFNELVERIEVVGSDSREELEDGNEVFNERF